MAALEQIRPAAESNESLWLHPEAGADGRIVVKDQFGRQLRGVRAIHFSASQQSANEMTVTFLCGTDGPMTNRAKGP